ncbi:MAG: type II toxin-antitoxin system VapB family antitoxin [Reyranella sp.]|uniref:hypothetical protein n=1 Tax=Reyranella sp. TaxID=1929291 RepID=UPI003D14440A
MPRRNSAQLNIRSAFACVRVREIARRTGMSATEIVEDALRGYVPMVEPEAVGNLVRRGPLLVLPIGNRRKVRLAEANAALDATRDRRS